MSVGLKGKGREIFLSLPALLNKKSGFTLVEILVVAFILIIITTALMLVLSTGEFSNSVSSARVDLQAEVRRAMDWIIKDVRSTVPSEINNNSPSSSHIKFRQITGIDNTDGSFTFGLDYIEYNYDAVSGTLTRNGIILSGSITEAPFYTAVGVPLVAGGIITSKKLVVKISGQKLVRGNLPLNFSLIEEVRIRNE